ncbi:hypothetical protein HYPSUDRAFT_209034 [Hypholoma sublateritium FD-334 SS-4]|uniref:Uncharacterized protein n=1 Tax=Hypholoma sublateritium (strain FD-334 SS-4) TaxID=945553 RepID=A0A0D2LT96_HYPSF|nr:hypothetical protein HYPSUDRAFT_209034 [Hypholoma sublateritium FD-334 SS-4]
MDDPPWAFDVISKHLTAHPVPDIVFDFGKGFSPSNIVLEGIGALRRLTIKRMDTVRFGVSVPHMMELRRKFKTVIESSPELGTLIIVTSPLYSPADQGLDLHHFLPDTASGTTTTGNLTIKSLSLHSRQITLKDQMFSHLRLLENLSITSYGSISSMLSQVWDNLRKKGIKLKKITTNVIDVDIVLLEYLEYCEDTLIELTLEDGASLWYNHHSSNSNATYFYNHVLQKLAPMLKVLHIRAPDADDWCFGSDNYLAFGSCTNLEELSVSIVDFTQPHSLHTQLLLEKTKAKLSKNVRVNIFNVCLLPQIG